MESAATDEPVVTDNPGASRYELHVGADLAGFLDYRLRDHDGARVISLVHTQVEPAFQGAHLATRLARFSLDDARARGLLVLPFCPYINSWISKHPEYTDLVPEERRGEFGLLPAGRRRGTGRHRRRWPIAGMSGHWTMWGGVATKTG